MTYLVNYLILSELLMIIYIYINSGEIRKSYIKFESKRGGKPTSNWYMVYVLSHILKAPLLCPHLVLLFLLNGGMLITEDGE